MVTSNDKENGVVHEDGIFRSDTAHSINISREMFEKFYLQPQNRVHGDLRQTFANPTPL